LDAILESGKHISEVTLISNAFRIWM